MSVAGVSPRKANQAEGRLSIGALSRATGIPVETLRTWERRYRFPVPMRKPSGHRVYPLSAVPRLRRVAEAIARGHRAAEVVPIPEAALENLLDSLSPRPSAELPEREPPAVPAGVPVELKDLMGCVVAYDGAELRRKLEILWLAQGPVRFLEHTATPFLEAIGRAWERGQLGIRHEHFASARLADFLREVRRPYEDRARGPRVALLTLPGDQHEMGLLMASLLFALESWQVLYLGPNTPPDQVGSLARDAALGAVAVSVSASSGGDAAERAVRALRRAVPRSVPLLLGGDGAPHLDLQNVSRVSDLDAARAWAAARYRAA